MKFHNLLKYIFQQNAELRLETNDMESEITGILKYPELYDCIIKEYNRECLQQLNDYHNKAKNLEIDIKSSGIIIKVEGEEEKLYKYEVYLSDLVFSFKRELINILSKTETIYILSFSFEENFCSKYKLKSIIEDILRSYKKQLLIHKTGVNTELDLFCLKSRDYKNYIQYFYERNGITYCAYFTFVSNLLSYRYIDYMQVATYLYARAEGLEKYREIEESYKNCRNFNELGLCYDIYIKTLHESFVSDYLNKTSFKIIDERFYKNFSRNMDEEQNNKIEEYIGTLKLEKQEKYKNVFVNECTCRIKKEFIYMQFPSNAYYYHHSGCKINTDVDEYKENIRKAFLEDIFKYLYNNHYDIMEHHVNVLFVYFFPKEFFNELGDLLSGLKLILYRFINLYNIEKENLSDDLRRLIKYEMDKILNEFYKSKITEKSKEIVRSILGTPTESVLNY